ncbi:MAG: 4a-hydroxytetrahydrobiopterin dehydratase [Patescibacteria group bacterium]
MVNTVGAGKEAGAADPIPISINPVGYDRVKIETWTHAIGGLSINDFILASKIDEIK